MTHKPVPWNAYSKKLALERDLERERILRAAPDMLAALKAIEPSISSRSKLAQVRAAIAKAEGKS
jgi:hypothetical protein